MHKIRAFFLIWIGWLDLACCVCLCAGVFACVLVLGNALRLGVSFLKNVLFWTPLVRKMRAFFKNLAWLACVLACLRACLWPVMRFGIGLVGWWGGRWDGWLVWFGLAWFGLVRVGSFLVCCSWLAWFGLVWFGLVWEDVGVLVSVAWFGWIWLDLA